jgi:hypothetical protein
VMKIRSYCRKYLRFLILAAFCLIIVALSGCVMAGPKHISMGRADYNEVINRTEDEQMLLAIVKGRYGETTSLLTVSGVAANVRFNTTVGLEAGFGSKDISGENLLIGGLAYEENPTITYAPVQGEKYLWEIFSPIPIDFLVLSIRNYINSALFLSILTNRINDMRNPTFLVAPSAAPDHRFQRFAELFMELSRSGVLDTVVAPEKDHPFSMLITRYAPDHSEKVHEYLRLLGLPIPEYKTEDIIIPLYFAIKGQESEGIAISTRSTIDLIQILEAAIEIPEEHASEGIAINYPALGLPGKDIHIHSSKDKPGQATVAVKYRGYWFYIDDTDINTKLFYKIVRSLWSVSIAASADQRATPVLTLPVSR